MTTQADNTAKQAALQIRECIAAGRQDLADRIAKIYVYGDESHYRHTRSLRSQKIRANRLEAEGLRQTINPPTADTAASVTWEVVS